MRVAFAAGEAVPYCKTGGLADVAGALPKALAAAGLEVSLFLPLYRSARAAAHAAVKKHELSVIVAGHAHGVSVLHEKRAGVDVYLLDCPEYFDRDGLYGDGLDFPDNDERYALYARAVLQACLLPGMRPDVFHCHDWQAGLIPALLKTAPEFAGLAASASLFTIHNIAYQGLFSAEATAKAGLAPWSFTPDGVEFYGKTGYLKAGMAYADAVSTVSPRYCVEIRRPEFGGGLDGLLNARAKDLFGILNGIDMEIWNPVVDAALPQRYSAADAARGKAFCKRELQQEAGLPMEQVPLIASVTRLDLQKGVDLALEVLPKFIEQGAQFILVGTGDPKLEKMCEAFAGRFPSRVVHRRSFDDGFARRVYAGGDLFLMPSRFEPCGLGQLIAMRYGTVPVAVRTGGLADTVEPTGFLAEAPTAQSVEAALSSALRAFADAPAWARRVKEAMGRDFGWEASARRYTEVYEEARRRHGIRA